ncbi:single-stranded-DNA-specific exonuclease [Algoriella xinjiangensis]|uniref:Single-stranded-DNA-specific exonuclease RecJ n=1 Tax=Algoriella xinjiangensis TaxID=684065 RepID=A0A1I4U1E4_9FLAO|nr:single-stranded-DNA-specific exonuclease RecJ [Algoriella xinjiangensis]SFM82699.1 single-stranded-DNA-specific exonuclease [Algoriella xinjiangensis]VDH17778.1 Single-stranded-DNA-specific exonuclease recJ [Algoriella xinjiangensis]
MEKTWDIKQQPSTEIINDLQQSLNISETLAILLAQRGITDFEQAKSYFNPSLDNLHDPFLMKGMADAVSRIKNAIEDNENILIFGDYDVDGTTAVTLFYEFLTSIYSNVFFYIPDRNNEGYGISQQSIDFALDNNISLVIVLDCGIKAHEQILYAQSKGIDYIICDHHLPDKSVPKAYAVLDPKQRGCRYPYKDLSGCGVGFKLAQAYTEKFNLPKENLLPLLDLVAVSIAADIVPITGENRILAYAGLKKLNSEPRLAFQHLIPTNIRNNVNISNVVFSIAPKINAAGRIKHGSEAVRFMLSRDEEDCKRYLSDINSLNNERKVIDVDITESALRQLNLINTTEKYSTIVYDPTWNKGVIGIVASRLVDLYYKPTIVFTKNYEGELVGSARSVQEFDIHEAIARNKALLTQFGGHMAAAGLALKEENFEQFKIDFDRTVKEMSDGRYFKPSIEIDKELSFNDITKTFLETVMRMAPFGPENMNPVFISRNLVATDFRLVGKEHARLFVHQNDTRVTFPAIGFKLGKFGPQLEKGQTFEMVYTIGMNYWQGKGTWQLNIKDIRFTD